MRRLAAFLAGSLLLAAASAGAQAQTLPELFQQAKAQVKSESWKEALKTLDALEAEANRPGNDEAKKQLAAPMAFYRGVCEANLDMAEKAQADFATFQTEKPGSTIDTAMYSKKAVLAFEAAARRGAAPAGSLSLFQRFEQFPSPPDMGEKPDERWADGPVKWILTGEEKGAWGGLAGAGERAEFVEQFWERRNPKPGSDDNTARTGFDRRVAFADAYFVLDEKQRGSLTDTGMVFILLGPPSWTGRKPILAGEDRSVSDGMSLDEQWFMASRNSVHIDGAQAPEASGAFREVWRYRREALPKGVSANQVNVVFVTKKGYGRSVLMRDPATVAALDAARAGRTKN